MNKQRLAILIVASLGAAATFLPWVKVPIIGTIKGTKGDGWITFILFSTPLIITLLKDKTKPIVGAFLILVIVPSIIASLFGIWKIVDFNSRMSELSDNTFGRFLAASVSVEFGLYLVVLSGFILPVLAYRLGKSEAAIKDSIKNENK